MGGGSRALTTKMRAMSDWRQDMLLTSTELARLRKARLLLRDSLEESVTLRLDQRLTSSSTRSARSGSVLSVQARQRVAEARPASAAVLSRTERASGPAARSNARGPAGLVLG